MFPSSRTSQLLLLVWVSVLSPTLFFSTAFAPLSEQRVRQRPAFTQCPRHTTTLLSAVYSKSGKFSSNNNNKSGGGGKNSKNNTPSKRQERVGQLIQTELSRIIHSGTIKSTGRRSSDVMDDNYNYIPDRNRQAISVVNVNVSPDLRQARVSVSIRPIVSAVSSSTLPQQQREEDDDDDEEEVRGTTSSTINGSMSGSSAVEKRKTFSWLVQNTKAIKHTLAQRISHLKTCPDLTFTEVNVGAAVDVMYLIDKVSAGYKRDDVLTSLDGMDVEEFDWDDEEEDDDEDDDDDFFNSK